MSAEIPSPAYPPAHVEQRGSGPVVLLLHGWGASSALFHPIMTALEQSFTLIAPDFPGFGATPPPPIPWSIGDYTQWLLHLMDDLAITQSHIIGHSFGGRVAIKLASQCPERVEKLIVTGSAGIRPKRTLRYYVQVRSFKTLHWLALAPAVPAILRRWAKVRTQKMGSSDYQQAAGTVRASFVRVVNEDLRAALPHIQSPTLLIWGEQDKETPLTDGQLMERLIPDAGLVVFDGAGHYAYLEQSARFCRIVETFLQGTS